MNVDHLLDQIGQMLAANKEILIDGVDWQRHVRAGGFDALEFAAPIAKAGVIINGLQARISCRSDLVDCDVHAQLQVYVPAISGYAHVQRVEWRPNSRHTNDASAPAHLRFRTFTDRWHEFGLNRRLGVSALRQTGPMIAQPLPRKVGNFNELLELLQEVWKVEGLSRIPPPPWEDRIV